MAELTVDLLCSEAIIFSAEERIRGEHSLFGVNDGKTIGTYLELKFRTFLIDKGYTFDAGNSAHGLDFPGLNLDMKVTSIRKPQSSCPFRSIRQKVYGIGYSLIIFLYVKTDNPVAQTAIMDVKKICFVDATCTANFQMTKGLLEILDDEESNEDDLAAFIASKCPTIDRLDLIQLTNKIISCRPQQGYLSITSAMQWRLKYNYMISNIDIVPGLELIL